MRLRASVLLAALLGALWLAGPSSAQEESPTVRAVLFFSPTCGHCEYVIQDVLPPLFVQHGGPWEIAYDESLVETGVPFYLLSNGTLEFLLVDVTVPEGSALFVACAEALEIDSGGVPRLVIADEVMIGSSDIPERLPAVIDEAVAGSGLDWPAFPGVVDAIATIPPLTPTTTTTPDSTTSTSAASSSPTTVAAGPTLPVGTDSLGDRFGRDPFANAIAVLVLLGMLASLGMVTAMSRRRQQAGALGVSVPLLALLGLGVAVYLFTIELGDLDAVCGPVGDCHAVQDSEYARILGVPIGLVGLIGYVSVLAAWGLQRARADRLADVARTALLAGTVGGVVFSVYLTFLEPFVIGATCAWCLTSAVIVTLLMWGSVRPGLASWRRLRDAPRQLELQLQ